MTDYCEPVIRFLFHVIDKHLTDEELIYCIKLISSQDSQEKQEQVRLACENREMRENKEILNKIANLETAEQQKAMMEEYLKEIEIERVTDELNEKLESLDSYISYYENLNSNIRRALSNKTIGTETN